MATPFQTTYETWCDAHPLRTVVPPPRRFRCEEEVADWVARGGFGFTAAAERLERAWAYLLMMQTTGDEADRAVASAEIERLRIRLEDRVFNEVADDAEAMLHDGALLGDAEDVRAAGKISGIPLADFADGGSGAVQRLYELVKVQELGARDAYHQPED